MKYPDELKWEVVNSLKLTALITHCQYIKSTRRARSCCHGFQWGRRDCCGLSKWSSRNSRQSGGLASGRLPLCHRQEWLPKELDSQFGTLCCWSLVGQKFEWHWPNGTSAWGLYSKNTWNPCPVLDPFRNSLQSVTITRLALLAAEVWSRGHLPFPACLPSLCWVHSGHPSLVSRQPSAKVLSSVL